MFSNFAQPMVPWLPFVSLCNRQWSNAVLNIPMLVIICAQNSLSVVKNTWLTWSKLIMAMHIVAVATRKANMDCSIVSSTSEAAKAHSDEGSGLDTHL